MFCWWAAGDSVVCVPLQSGFCAVAETSGTEFSDIDLSQKVRRKPSYMALCRLVPCSVPRQEWSEYDEDGQQPVSILEVEHQFIKM